MCVAYRVECAILSRDLLHEIDLRIGVRSKPVDTHDW